MKVQKVVITLPEKTVSELLVAKDDAPVFSNENWIDKWHDFRNDKFGLSITDETQPGLTEEQCLSHILDLANGNFIM